MNFAAGRLKFTGTLAFPANKYLVLRLGGGPGGSLLAEDVFENMVRACCGSQIKTFETWCWR
jgi:hypothetical protein